MTGVGLDVPVITTAYTSLADPTRLRIVDTLRKAANEKDVVVRNAVSRALRGAAT